MYLWRLRVTDFMNNRLIYLLISLMLVSLVGIIWIQTSWIRDSIAESERDFEVRVNNALNAVNDDIDTEEAEKFLKREFGGVDSLVNEFVFFPKDSNAILEVNVNHAEGSQPLVHDEVVIIESTPDSKNQAIVVGKGGRNSDRTIVVSDSIPDSIGQIVWDERIETRLEEIDSTLKERRIVVEQRHRVQSVVKRYTYEMLLTGDLKERIDPDSLENKIKQALNREGISGMFTYAVRNGNTNDFEEEYASVGFDTTNTGSAFTKRLFQNDRRNRMNYTLYVQPEDTSEFVWSRVWKMTLLSILFTVLIVLSFGYALYFIFKQKKISQIKNDFINNMTHELKTPLASISLASASINHPEIIKNPEEVRRLTKMIDAEKERINSHVERVLDTAALDSGELKLSLETVPVLPLLQSAQKNVELSLKHTEGIISLPEEIYLNVQGDPFHLTNVFTNILDNSIKYRSSDPPEIKVEIREKDKMVQISFEDNGIGMTSKQQKHAFDAFYRAETGDVHNRKGFGLGLSYVRGVVQKHGGQVFLKSKPRQGTTVIIELRYHE